MPRHHTLATASRGGMSDVESAREQERANSTEEERSSGSRSRPSYLLLQRPFPI